MKNTAKQLTSYYSDYPEYKELGILRNAESFAIAKYAVPGSVLDIGCGTGAHTSLLYKEHACFCIDAVYENARKSHLYGSSLQSLAQSIPFISNCFDNAICMGHTLGHLNREERKKSLSEIYRVLKHGGIFIFSVWSDSVSPLQGKEIDCVKTKSPGHGKDIYLHFFTRQDIREISHTPGFETAKILELSRNAGSGNDYFITVLKKPVIKMR